MYGITIPSYSAENRAQDFAMACLLECCLYLGRYRMILALVCLMFLIMCNIVTRASITNFEPLVHILHLSIPDVLRRNVARVIVRQTCLVAKVNIPSLVMKTRRPGGTSCTAVLIGGAC